MFRSNVRRLAVSVALMMGFVQAASAADILIGDAKSQPESLTVAPGGVLIVGSASSPFVYKVRPGSTTAEKFIDVSTEGPGTFFLGMLADASTNTLWTCQLTPVPNTTPPAAAYRAAKLRSHDWRAEDPLESARRQQCLQRFHDWTGQGALHHGHDSRQNLPAAGWRLHRGALSGASDAQGRRWHYLPRWRALREQRDLQQALSHSRRCHWQTGNAGRYLDGPAGKRAGWHARGER